MKFPIDLTTIDSHKERDGYRLQCPYCQDWANKLLILASGELVCRKCAKTIRSES